MRKDQIRWSSFMLLPHNLPDYCMGKSEQLADQEEINFFSDSISEEKR